MAQLAERYLAEHAEVKKKPASTKTDRETLRDYVLPKLGHLGVEDVSRQDVTALHHRSRGRPYVGYRMLTLVFKMLNLVEKWGLRPDGSNPCRRVEKFKEYKRERYLTKEELSRLTQAIAEAEAEGTESVHALAALRLLILTGCPLREILHLRCEHVGFEHGRLALPDSKSGAKTVFLATAAQEVLTGIPRTNGSSWVIERRKPKSHLSDLKGLSLAETVRESGAEGSADSRSAAQLCGGGRRAESVAADDWEVAKAQSAADDGRYAHIEAVPMQEAASRGPPGPDQGTRRWPKRPHAKGCAWC